MTATTTQRRLLRHDEEGKTTPPSSGDRAAGGGEHDSASGQSPERGPYEQFRTGRLIGALVAIVAVMVAASLL